MGFRRLLLCLAVSFLGSLVAFIVLVQGRLPYVSGVNDCGLDCVPEPHVRACRNGDVNGGPEGNPIDIADAIYLLNYLFAGGPEPVPIACADDSLATRVAILEERLEQTSQALGIIPVDYCTRTRPDLELGRWGVSYNPATITDRVTGLMWAFEMDVGQTRNWYEAKAYCEGLRYADQSDWRMPDMNELAELQRSLLPSLGEWALLDFENYRKVQAFWSATNEVGQDTWAWQLRREMRKVVEGYAYTFYWGLAPKECPDCDPWYGDPIDEVDYVVGTIPVRTIVP